MLSEDIFNTVHCAMRSQVDEDGSDGCKEKNHGATCPPQSPPPSFISPFLSPSISKGGGGARRSQEIGMRQEQQPRGLKRREEGGGVGSFTPKTIPWWPAIDQQDAHTSKTHHDSSPFQSLWTTQEMIPAQHNNSWWVGRMWCIIPRRARPSHEYRRIPNKRDPHNISAPNIWGPHDISIPSKWLSCNASFPNKWGSLGVKPTLGAVGVFTNIQQGHYH
jgi:hypothetical protein